MKKKLRTKLWIVMALFCIMAVGSYPQHLQAAVNETEEQPDDPEYGRAMGNASDEFYDDSNQDQLFSQNTGSPYIGGTYVHNSRFDGMAVKNGIDVSYYQKDINWSAVRAAGVEYAFVRVGYRGATSGALYADNKYAQNLKNAAAAGVKVGVYIYSQATTEAEAVDEASFVLNRISGYDIKMPVVIDYEYDNAKKGRLYTSNISKEQATNVVNAFCNKVSQAGYTPMVYANKDMLERHLNASAINHPVWLANYTSQTGYAGSYSCWQYTSKGSVNGISGYVDCNFWYGELGNVYTGFYNGVDYTSVFSPEDYAHYNHDVAQACGNDKQKLLEHFVNYGMAEGRRAKVSFCVKSYKEKNPDVAQSCGSDWKNYYMHYINYGKKEGRNCSVLPKYATRSYDGVDYSAVYDYETYLMRNGDIKSAYADNDLGAICHFINYGMNEARNASDTFNVYAYRAQNADIRQAYGTDWKKYYMHYIQYGKKEGRKATGSTTLAGGVTTYNGVDYSPVYNFQYYIEHNPDVAAAYSNDDEGALEQFANYGMKEARNASDTFNVYAYRAQNADIRQAYGTDWKKYYMHYIQYGKKEGRKATGSTTLTGGVTTYNGVDYSPVYNFQYYIEHNPDVAAAYGNDDEAALVQFVNYGMNEARSASASFDVKAYRAAYADVRQTYGKNWKNYYMHYILYGKNEGRKGTGSQTIANGVTVYNGVDYSPVYNFQYYIAHNPDVAAAYGNDDEEALEHFVNCGMNEGRVANSSFNVHIYRQNYKDVEDKYGNNLKEYYMHYLLYGKAEGRRADVLLDSKLKDSLEKQVDTDDTIAVTDAETADSAETATDTETENVQEEEQNSVDTTEAKVNDTNAENLETTDH